jgi:ubiquinone/menaquinone biosynthesis C-methylase UbiE
METKRVLDVYRERELKERDRETFFGYQDLAHFFRIQNRYRTTLSLLKSTGRQSLANTRVLDIGCGNGDMLRQFLQWNAKPENLAGIELRPAPVEYALTLNPNLDIRCGSATALPWSGKAFDMVSQHTVFTSTLDQEIRKEIASEMLRVLKPNGIILWYDFWLNPTNPQTRGIRPAEIRELFPNCNFEFHKITLAPPLARKIVPLSWELALFLEGLKIFNSHYIAVISPKG